eukprot:5002012-Pyramimonas_sp.AAC.1
MPSPSIPPPTDPVEVVPPPQQRPRLTPVEEASGPGRVQRAVQEFDRRSGGVLSNDVPLCILRDRASRPSPAGSAPLAPRPTNRSRSPVRPELPVQEPGD